LEDDGENVRLIPARNEVEALRILWNMVRTEGSGEES
jgi:hypothetical protein